MSLFTEALLEITTAGVSPESLRQWLEANPTFASELAEFWGDRWLPKAWEIDVPGLHLRGPGGFYIRFESRTLLVGHCMHFFTFARAPEQRHAFRRACFGLAGVVGSSRAIFTHEMMLTPEEGLDGNEARLRLEFGTPAASFEQLSTAEPYARGAWYIDDFDDLRLVQMAEEIARKVHAGQFRRAGVLPAVPYIEHLRAVVHRVRDDPEAQVVAWLREVLAEGAETEESLRKAGIPSQLIAAIALMTRAWGTTHEDYFERIAGSPLPTKVTIAVLIVNLAGNPTPDEMRNYASGLFRLTREDEAGRPPSA
jgi:hypothetical protein